jgi:hypothetical protein
MNDWALYFGVVLVIGLMAVLTALLWAVRQHGREARAWRAAAEALNTRIDLLEDQLVRLQRERPTSPESPAAPVSEPAETAYARAIRLARQGLDPLALAEDCGISRGEAELIVALYRANRRE